MEKSLPQLIKQSTTYKLFVPKKVEEKIRYLCRKFPTLEWSGILFYTHTGSFEENNLKIYCEDIYPMDLGTSTYTSFKNDETITGYIADNIELFNCDIGILHSHNNMNCWFSGTDLSTLQSEGNDTNCFVSLIVNNAGTYCAAITRKVQSKKNIITEYLGSSYEFFGDGAVQLTGGDVGKEEEVETTSIEYFMLDVEREVVDNPFDFLDKRFDEIEAKKKTVPDIKVSTNPWLPKPKEDNSFRNWLNTKDTVYDKYEQPSLFSKEEMEEITDASEWQPDPTIIHHLVCQIITCSFIVTKDLDLKQWITRYMEKKYDEIFELPGIFEEWLSFIIEFQLMRYNDDLIPEELIDDYDALQSKVAKSIYDELYQYEDCNTYIEDYLKELSKYIYE